jgi:hypothetical protein
LNYDAIRHHLACDNGRGIRSVWVVVRVQDEHVGNLGTKELSEKQIRSGIPPLKYRAEELLSDVHSLRWNLIWLWILAILYRVTVKHFR